MRPLRTATTNPESRTKYTCPSRILWTVVVIVGVAFVWAAGAFGNRWPVAQNQYAPRPASEWTRLARAKDAAVLPFLIDQLKDHSHRPLLQKLEWIRWHLPQSWQWSEAKPCGQDHQFALDLLRQMGETAQTAIPDIIRCFESCPDNHYADGLEYLETIAEIGHAATNAVSFLTGIARGHNSYAVRAAATEYLITGRTNLLVETVFRLAKSDPREILGAREIFWFRHDTELNQVFVSLFVRLLFDSRMSEVDRQGVVFELRARGVDSLPALPFLLLGATTSPQLRSDVMAALPCILGLTIEGQEFQNAPATAPPGTPDTKAEVLARPASP